MFGDIARSSIKSGKEEDVGSPVFTVTFSETRLGNTVVAEVSTTGFGINGLRQYGHVERVAKDFSKQVRQNVWPQAVTQLFLSLEMDSKQIAQSTSSCDCKETWTFSMEIDDIVDAASSMSSSTDAPTDAPTSRTDANVNPGNDSWSWYKFSVFSSETASQGRSVVQRRIFTAGKVSWRES